MAETMKTIDSVDPRPFKKLIMTIGELPTSFLESMTYYEMLAWFVDYLQNTIIPAVNNNAAVLKELQTAFVTLKNYVDNYFANLDVQEEINNKLDAMVEAGTLQEIIADYLNSKAVFGYDNVADMKAATNLINGSYAETLGYHSKGDYGSALYSIVDDELTADDKEIIALDNGLFAVLNLKENVIKPEQFGAYGDGTHDDTTAVQATINYSIAHALSVEFNGDYLVSPTLRDDNTYVCLTYEKRNTGMQFAGTELKFNRSSRIRTQYNDGECTLLRIEARNIIISDGIFEGIQGKTNLLEFSRINKISSNYDGYNLDNIVNNCILRYGKDAIRLEGTAYYNKFNSCRIFNCTNGIVLAMATIETSGIQTDSNVNRNDFNDINMNLITNWGVRIEYGGTNKFVNLDIEGAGNGIYLDNPRSHSSDFTITPLYDCSNNTFVNVMMESITTSTWYNNAYATYVYGASLGWDSNAQMIKQPEVFLAGAGESSSIEKIDRIIINKDNVAQSGILANTISSKSHIGAANFYDMKFNNDGTVTNMSLQTLEFEIKANSNIASLTYNEPKPKIKRIGNIVHIFGSFVFQPTTTTANVKLYLPSAWQTPKNLATQFIGPATPVGAYVGNHYVTVYASIKTDANGSWIQFDLPNGLNWGAGNSNYILLQDLSYLTVDDI